MSALRAPKRIVVVALAVAAVLSLTACSSSGSGGSAATPGERAALDFAQCIRDNGVPSFPDPVAAPDGGFRLQRPAGVPPGALDDALKSCQSKARAAGIDASPAAPDTGAQDQLLKLSRCMRDNGIPEFPDPEPGSDALGGLHGLFATFDLQSPRVARALRNCQSVVNQLLAPVHGGGS